MTFQTSFVTAEPHFPKLLYNNSWWLVLKSPAYNVLHYPTLWKILNSKIWVVFVTRNFREVSAVKLKCWESRKKSPKFSKCTLNLMSQCGDSCLTWVLTNKATFRFSFCITPHKIALSKIEVLQMDFPNHNRQGKKKEKPYVFALKA